MWRKSSKSNTGGQCVEVWYVKADPTSAIRDSKKPDGSALAVPGLVQFISAVKGDRIGR